MPLAAASIGQVHRAVVVDPATGLERAVAVKVQYPGVGEAIAADLRNADLLGALLRQGFGGLDPDDMVAEIKDAHHRRARLPPRGTQPAPVRRPLPGPPVHPRARAVLPTLSTGRVLTTELVTGATWAEALTWDQHQRDQIGECLFRFVFRSLYGMHLFNGDPHPGNYLFHGDGKVTFLDFGLVKQFTDVEMSTFISMVRTAAYEHDVTAFRATLELAGMLRPGAPVDDHDGRRVLQPVLRERAPRRHRSRGRASTPAGIVRHTFDRSSPISQYATVPRAFVFIQRINLGLYALLGELHATGNYRRMAEELWPFVQGPPSTPMAQLEQPWLARVARSTVSGHGSAAAVAAAATRAPADAPRTGRVSIR